MFRERVRRKLRRKDKRRKDRAGGGGGGGFTRKEYKGEIGGEREAGDLRIRGRIDYVVDKVGRELMSDGEKEDEE